VARGGPQFEFRVTSRAKLQEVIVAAVVNLDCRDALGVAAIEAFRQPQNRGKGPHRAPRPPRQIAEAVVPALRSALAVIAGDERDRFYFVRLEAAQVAVFH